ncbi:hypothetical protein [Metabacillus fastidiosus]|uniref:hypothetical protein n=1 Tax=Metabacillus fastidiosus TaxID=1458 RepID=UPI003D2AD89A
MDSRLKERIMSVESDLGRELRNDLLNNETSTIKKLKKNSKKLIDEDMIRERYFEDIEKVNNSIFLPLIYSFTYEIDQSKDMSYTPFTIDTIKNMQDEQFGRLMDVVGFVTSLLILDMDEEQVLNVTNEKFLK